jgi:chromodomain-helicase-DNA-binding protein 4
MTLPFVDDHSNSSFSCLTWHSQSTFVEPINMSRSRGPFVLPPRLPAAQKIKYKPTNETSLRAEGVTRVNEVIGEYLESNVLYYYARYDDGIAHRVRVFPSLSNFQ